jgi:DNA-binding MarR family transcriptional regulator
VLISAREIQFRGYTSEQAIPLSQSEGMVMRYLQTEPAAPPNRIAAGAGLQRTNVSTVLRGLEQKGLIERHASRDDRRGMIVRTTERGKSNYALVGQEWASAVSAAPATTRPTWTPRCACSAPAKPGWSARGQPHPAGQRR